MGGWDEVCFQTGVTYDVCVFGGLDGNNGVQHPGQFPVQRLIGHLVGRVTTLFGHSHLHCNYCINVFRLYFSQPSLIKVKVGRDVYVLCVVDEEECQNMKGCTWIRIKITLLETHSSKCVHCEWLAYLNVVLFLFGHSCYVTLQSSNSVN